MPRGTYIISDKTIQPTQPGPRAGLIASRDLHIQALDRCHRDCAVATTKINGKQTLVGSIYLDIKKPAAPKWLEDLLNMANKKKLPLLLAMDSNAHSSLYGPDNNSRGDEFEDLILQHGLEVHNEGPAPTFETKRGDKNIATHIDLSLIHI